MLKRFSALVLLAALVSTQAFAAETAAEHANANGRDAKHAGKKGMNRVKEAVCTEGDATCAAEKGKHRVEEGVDATKNAGKKAVDKVD